MATIVLGRAGTMAVDGRVVTTAIGLAKGAGITVGIVRVLVGIAPGRVVETMAATVRDRVAGMEDGRLRLDRLHRVLIRLVRVRDGHSLGDRVVRRSGGVRRRTGLRITSGLRIAVIYSGTTGRGCYR